MQFNHSSFETLCAKETFNHKDFQFAHNLPIVSSSTFIYENPTRAMNYFAGTAAEHMNIYSRWANPTVMALEEKLALIEAFELDIHAQCFVFSSGMAAISTAVMALAHAGDYVLTQGNLYGTTTELFQTTLFNQHVTCLEIDCTQLDEVETYLHQYSPKVLYLESPSNPTMQCVDIQQLSTLAKKYNCKVIVDNTFNTAYVQQPLALGADVVVYSTTKFLNGHGSALGGAIISPDKQYMQHVWKLRKTLGHVASPFDAWLTYNGLKTLPLRMRKHIQNAEQIAQFLENHPSVAVVNYVGLPHHGSHQLAIKQMHNFGSILSFELKGGLEAGKKLLRSIELLSLTASLGTTDTLISHPASMTHAVVPQAQREEFGISDGLIRLSVGLEGATDIMNDLSKGLA